jgi:hypothetical protein
MSHSIKDGTGNGYLAEVDIRKRLHTFATTQSGFKSAVKKGDAYLISSGVITLTDATESGILYIQSLETSDLVIEEIQIQTGVSTGGTGDVLRRDYVQPTTGTLITDQATAGIGNLLAASSNTLTAVYYTGDQGKTVGGALFNDTTIHHLADTDRSNVGFIIPKGAALGLSLQPPTGNTSLNVQAVVTVYLLDSE